MPTVLSHYLNGRREDGTSSRFQDVFNPSTGSTTAKVPLASLGETTRAVDLAQAAAVAWGNMPAAKRARIITRFTALCIAHADELTAIIAAEHGKVLADARGSLERGLEVLEFARGIPHLLKGEHSHGISTDMDMYSLRKPLGVVAGITPFNFPAMVPMWMFGIAIACGNSFILKPSEKTPSCALRLAELFSEAGLPPGVFNVLNGDAECVNALLSDPRVQAVSFVGSTPVARQVYDSATAAGKRCQALGSAKNHMVVMPDADLDNAANALIGAAYGSAGERCMATSVVVVVGNVADQFVDLVTKRVRALRVGAADDPQADFGPLVTNAHRERIRAYIALGIDEGAQAIVDGRDTHFGDTNGFFIGPSLFDRVEANMRFYQEEIFGPVLQIVRVANFDAAINLPSRHPYGNGASIFTSNGSYARAFADRVEVGMVGINVPSPVPLAFHTFSGWKDSAFGDLGMHGIDGVRFFTKLKTVTSRWSSEDSANSDMGMPIFS
jgi:malonate-semialdehyde dehydrogenase (acetylating)/methylmalonate-semialdehyde dehydrogenase